MADETIVAVFDTVSDADAAVRDLEAAGVPSSSISRHAHAGTGAGDASVAPRETGFWSNLFGGEPEHDTSVYDRSLETGATVVTVRTPDSHVVRVTEIFERHNPVDLNERASSYAVSDDATVHDSTAAVAAMGGVSTGMAHVTGRVSGAAANAEGGETLSLAEEVIAVGKRLVNRGTTRVHRFVTETPFEENVTLRDETVSVERRPVTDGRAVTDADFTDKVIEVTETDEEAVVSKTARVREEVVIGKTATDRTETVRDTVRREDVKIERIGGETTLADAGARPGVVRPK